MGLADAGVLLGLHISGSIALPCRRSLRKDRRVCSMLIGVLLEEASS